jgi:hypothetical protein
MAAFHHSAMDACCAGAGIGKHREPSHMDRKGTPSHVPLFAPGASQGAAGAVPLVYDGQIRDIPAQNTSTGWDHCPRAVRLAHVCMRTSRGRAAEPCERARTLKTTQSTMRVQIYNGLLVVPAWRDAARAVATRRPRHEARAMVVSSKNIINMEEHI